MRFRSSRRAARCAARADAMVADGRLLDAVDALTDANRELRDADIERRLVPLRHEAYWQLPRVAPTDAWPVITPGEPIVESGLASVDAHLLTPELIATGIHRHGALHVRRLVPDDRVARLVEGIDRAMAGFDAHASGAAADDTAPWFEAFRPRSEFTVGVKRTWVRDSGGVWTADSPRVLADLVDTLDAVGLTSAINVYFGERPVLSVNKCTLRRVGSEPGYANWHQDGAFLGDGIRSINVWMSLSHCGIDAPGLDVVPRRFDRVLETGTQGAMFDWAVGRGVIDAVSEDSPVCRPVFEPGDVLLFDDLFLHRTAADESMPLPRHAIETWFFAPSSYPDGQIPLVF
jgi:hypothetical protein